MRMISFWSRLLDLISPRACVVCGERLAVSEECICGKCNLRLPRTHYHFSPSDNDMAKLFWLQMPVQKVSALMFYEPHSPASRIVYRLKYMDAPEIGVLMGRMMAEEFSASGFFSGIDLLVPVPLTKKRQRRRGYNQSAEIAKGVSEVTGIPVVPDILHRQSFRENQTQKDRWQRHDNVKEAFRLVAPERLNNKNILLIDDVATTGATLLACGGELLKAENVSVSILTLGYTKG